MSIRVLILSPDPGDEGFQTRWRGPMAQNVGALERAGMAVEQRSWVEPIRPGEYDLILPLLTWGYHRAGAQWQAAVDEWEAAGLPVQNPPEVLRWNSDKNYLGRLAERRAPVVPTLYADRLTREDMERAADDLGTDRLVAKPQISASSWQTIRWSPGGSLDGGPDGAAMIQPYLPAIETEGELSLIYFGRRFSHAIRKRPTQGFFVQPEHGGIVTDHEPGADELAAAEAILAAVDEELLYARIDLARDLQGVPVLMELELVEPDLYLERDPAQGAAFAEAVAGAAH